MGDDAVAEAESEELEDGSLSTSEIAIITCGSVRVTMSSSCCSEPFTSRFVQTDLVAGSSSSDEEKASRIMDGLRANGGSVRIILVGCREGLSETGFPVG